MSSVKPEDLKKAYKKERDPRVIKRMAAVNMVCMNNDTIQETADRLMQCPNWVSWVKRFEEGGIDAIRNLPRSGRKPKVALRDIEEAVSAAGSIRELKSQTFYDQMDSEKKLEFINDVKAQMKQNSYNVKVYEILNKLSEVRAEISAAEKNGDDTAKLTEKTWAIVFELEEYDVVSEERLLQNKEYWQSKAQEVIERLNESKTENTSSEFRDNDIVWVHTDDVSLKNQAEIEYKCHDWGFISFYCYQTDVEWGGGSTAHAQAVMIHPGTIYMEAGVCVHNNGGHDRVHFRYDTDHYVYNAFGTKVFDVSHDDYDASLRFGCSFFDEDYSGIAAIAGSVAHAESYLETTVTVSG